jgi:hypothetical protein
MILRTVSLDELTIDDEHAVAHVALYDRLKQALRRSGHRFRIPAPGTRVSWDRALFLNLTYWGDEDGADVLCDDHIPADVVAHVAWHCVVSRQLAARPGVFGVLPSNPPTAPPPTAAALFFAESIASAFDLYLVGRLIANAPDADFIATQVPIMSDCAQEAGLSESAFTALLQEVSREPERAFEDMRVLLLDAATALYPCRGAAEAQAVLEGFSGHRFLALLHHFQLSNWILYARAYAARPSGPDLTVTEVDAALRRAPISLDWLDERWIDADLQRNLPPAG